MKLFPDFFVDIKESITLNRRWHPFWNVQFWKHQVWLAAVWRPVYHSWTMRRICWWREWLWPVAACVSAPKPSGGWSPALCENLITAIMPCHAQLEWRHSAGLPSYRWPGQWWHWDSQSCQGFDSLVHGPDIKGNALKSREALKKAQKGMKHA